MPTSKFQLVILGLFGVLLIVGVIIFSLYKGGSTGTSEVVIWGTISRDNFEKIIGGTSLYQNREYKINYIEKSETEFDDDFIESLASGKGPDVFLLPSNKILKHRNKIFPIPYNVFSQRQFKNSFIEGTEIYIMPEGVLALPIIADPLVMYWNRSMFTGAQLTEPPKYWDEFYNLAKLITKKDGALNISKSAVALGEFTNISYAKEIILNMAIQAGTPVVTWSGDKIIAVLNLNLEKPIVPAMAAINFYTEFSNPAKSSYSWNRSLPDSVDYFLGGDLALYFGLASEISILQLKNPNLNFDVAPVPVSREGGNGVSFSNYEAFAISKSSKNPNAAFAIISILTDAESAKIFSKTLRLPPVRRDLLAQKPTDAFQAVFYNSTIRSKSWLDPSAQGSDNIFRDMIESITSGRYRTGEAITKAQNQLSALLNK